MRAELAEKLRIEVVRSGLFVIQATGRSFHPPKFTSNVLSRASETFQKLCMSETILVSEKNRSLIVNKKIQASPKIDRARNRSIFENRFGLIRPILFRSRRKKVSRQKNPIPNFFSPIFFGKMAVLTKEETEDLYASWLLVEKHIQDNGLRFFVK